ncbi:type I 3-dehydroquinate dehydratase [Desmospora activa]|uniref:3-dehydroquinate dehydratase n=1 Tax=Desmospora activa DSM 45169 TaxID=1121389 RepID=A0A2T4Z962_9BACL|nr:type I 3-dehydroquinate dehydratase [Desmospora activa]PTM58428.1 3-dehydroquinate dehydratase [Desmospora activa DSM 45169]
MNVSKRSITVKGTIIGGGIPLICTPLIGMDQDQILSELQNTLPKAPDLIEWRADFFSHLPNTDAVLDTLAGIQETIAQTPLLFTVRSQREGGEPIALSESDKLMLFEKVCGSGGIDLIDYELVNEKENIHHLSRVAEEAGVRLILSYHNFESTPVSSDILGKLLEAESRGADIAKVAVMPHSSQDLLTLLQATLTASQQLRIPLITMSMGGLGTLTRLAGWMFGSDVTFAIGKQGSAPGQIPIEELREVMQSIQQWAGGGQT